MFDFSNYVWSFCNTGVMAPPDYAKANPEIVYALVKSFEEAERLVYSALAYARKVARVEFSDMPGDVVDKAIDAEIKYEILAHTVVTQDAEWNKLMEMQKFLGNVNGSVAMSEGIDNSFADEAAREAQTVKAPM